MPRLSVPLFILLFMAGGHASASPVPGYLTPDPSRLFWFVVTTDTHIGARGAGPEENLAWVTRDAFSIIGPQYLFVCGDLTEAAGFLSIPSTQQQDEWELYRRILDDGGMTHHVYVDAPGNHDHYGDKGLTHYLRYSIQGSETNSTQQSFRFEPPFGTYHFLTAATPADDGRIAPFDAAALDPGELMFLQDALDRNSDASMHIVFGHHPVDRDFGNSIGSGKEEFKRLLKDYGATAYVFGHTHSYLEEFRDGTLHLNLDSLGKSDKDHVAIGVIDNNSLSIRAFAAGFWPMIVVSAPANHALGGDNPHAYTVPPNWTEAPVRAVVFSDKEIGTIEFQVDNGPWIWMGETTPNVYQGFMDTTGLAPGNHRLAVRSKTWPASAHAITFRIGPTACSNGIDDDKDGLTDHPEDPGCESPADNDEWNEQSVDEDTGTTQGDEGDPSSEEFVLPDQTDVAEETGPVDNGGSGFDAAADAFHGDRGPVPVSDLAIGDGLVNADTTGPADQGTIRETRKGGGCASEGTTGSRPWPLAAIIAIMGLCLLCLRGRSVPSGTR
jgi:hypothetical protein